MAKAKREKLPKFNTPIGIMNWPKLSEPDFGNEKYPKKDGEYSTRLVFQKDDPVFQAFIAKLEPLHAEAVKEGEEGFAGLKKEARERLKELTVHPLYTVLYDEETEEPTGQVELRFKMGASGERKDKTKWTARPGLFDAIGRPLPRKNLTIWNGTEGIISFEVNKYFVEGTGICGLSLRLKAAQIIKLVSAGNRSAESYGFGKEDGYEFSDADLADEEAALAEDKDSDGDDDKGADGDF